VLPFLQSLESPKLPPGILALNPYQNPVAFSCVQQFYKKYYSDENQRILIVGINPGRFGGGMTGIQFTDPIQLEMICGIKNDLSKKSELSSTFFYQVIKAFGGPDKFYKKFYVSAICPLGFVKEGKNMNFYDRPELQHLITPFILKSLKKQLDFGIHKATCICLGEGKNYKFLKKINEENFFFKSIIPLPHPRFIMQYRRKQVNDFIKTYLEALD